MAKDSGNNKPSNNGPERNKKGRFVKGNKGGPGGNKMSAHRKALRRAFDEAVTEEDMIAVVRKCVEQAKEGDAAARRELLDRLWGRAPQAINLGDADGDPLSIIINVKKLNGHKS